MGVFPVGRVATFKASGHFQGEWLLQGECPFKASDPFEGSGALKGISAFQRERV